jgi:hypothetical protein
MVVRWGSVCVGGHCQSIHLSVLHVCNLRASRHHLLSYPHKWGVTRHFGVDKTMAILQKHFSWSEIQQYVHKYIISCTSCTISKPVIKKHGLYTPLPTLDSPWESISMDHMYGLPSTKHGNDCVFLVVDQFSKMVVLAPYKNSIITEATTKLFFERVWVHFGLPRTIISDQDIRFLITFWSSLWSMMDTKLTKSIAFHPQTDGKTKIVNIMIARILRMYNSKHPCTWDESLPYVQHSYNKALHDSIGHNTFQV